MSDPSELRRQLRPHLTVALGCQNCVWRADCGGLDVADGRMSCLDMCRSDCTTCDNVCPRNPVFASQLAEIGGLRFDRLPGIRQSYFNLPHYVPHILHPYSRHKSLASPIVSLDLYQLFRRIEGNKYQLVARSPQDLRARFGLRPDTKVILRGTAHDKPLETYWAHRRRDKAAEQLAQLDILAVIGPNFSHFLDVPRTDNLFNRKRQLICLGEMCEAGLNVIPHLSAARSADWAFWRAFLRERPAIRYVAVEFQTGNKNKAEGRNVIRRIASIAAAIGHPLCPILIGGGQYVEEVATRFSSFTLIDSRPFMNAMKRHSFACDGTRGLWEQAPTPYGAGVDELMERNIRDYSAWVARRVQRAKGKDISRLRFPSPRVGTGSPLPLRRGEAGRVPAPSARQLLLYSPTR